MNDSKIWAEKYRPRTIQECILPAEMKAYFQNMIDTKHVDTLLLVGPAGVGKTTVARALLEELGYEYILINASMHGNIDTLRVHISQFASTISLNGTRKFVILDEADYLNANSTQPALRSFMDEFSDNCGFIMTANWVNRIIEPLQSRAVTVTFTNPKAEAKALAMEFFTKICGILDKEGVSYVKQAVAALVQKHYPDWRKVIVELQRYARKGHIDADVIAQLSDGELKELVDHLKAKDFSAMRSWVGKNADFEVDEIFRKLYDNAVTFTKPQYIPQLIVLIAKYQYQNAFVADREINLVACLTEIMVDIDFK